MIKKLSLITFSLILFLLLGNNSIYSNEDVDTGICNSEDGYSLYECRVKNICNASFDSSSRNNFTTDNYLEAIRERSLDNIEDLLYKETFLKNTDAGYYIAKASKNYKENMNSIYKCGVLNIQKKSLERIANELKEPKQKTQIGKKLESQITRVDLKIKTFKCNDAGNPIQKVEILKEASLETCKYHSYMEYMREYSKDLVNLAIRENARANSGTPNASSQAEQALGGDGQLNIKGVASREQAVKRLINSEIERAYKIFPIAFTAYSEYENNLPTHLLLELLKDDYRILRRSYHEVINPINQLVYKISNAMRR